MIIENIFTILRGIDVNNSNAQILLHNILLLEERMNLQTTYELLDEPYDSVDGQKSSFAQRVIYCMNYELMTTITDHAKKLPATANIKDIIYHQYYQNHFEKYKSDAPRFIALFAKYDINSISNVSHTIDNNNTVAITALRNCMSTLSPLILENSTEEMPDIAPEIRAKTVIAIQNGDLDTLKNIINQYPMVATMNLQVPERQNGHKIITYACATMNADIIEYLASIDTSNFKYIPSIATILNFPNIYVNKLPSDKAIQELEKFDNNIEHVLLLKISNIGQNNITDEIQKEYNEITGGLFTLLSYNLCESVKAYINFGLPIPPNDILEMGLTKFNNIKNTTSYIILKDFIEFTQNTQSQVNAQQISEAIPNSFSNNDNNVVQTDTKQVPSLVYSQAICAIQHYDLIHFQHITARCPEVVNMQVIIPSNKIKCHIITFACLNMRSDIVEYLLQKNPDNRVHLPSIHEILNYPNIQQIIQYPIKLLPERNELIIKQRFENNVVTILSYKIQSTNKENIAKQSKELIESLYILVSCDIASVVEKYINLGLPVPSKSQFALQYFQEDILQKKSYALLKDFIIYKDNANNSTNTILFDGYNIPKSILTSTYKAIRLDDISTFSNIVKQYPVIATAKSILPTYSHHSYSAMELACRTTSSKIVKFLIEKNYSSVQKIPSIPILLNNFKHYLYTEPAKLANKTEMFKQFEDNIEFMIYLKNSHTHVVNLENQYHDIKNALHELLSHNLLKAVKAYIRSGMPVPTDKEISTWANDSNLSSTDSYIFLTGFIQYCKKVQKNMRTIATSLKKDYLEQYEKVISDNAEQNNNNNNNVTSDMRIIGNKHKCSDDYMNSNKKGKYTDDQEIIRIEIENDEHMTTPDTNNIIGDCYHH